MSGLRRAPGCELCESVGGTLVARAPKWRIIRPDDAAFPAFYRLVWDAHVAEFTDLPDTDRAQCMNAVAAIERVLRDAVAPTKINLASLGNVVPHLHWHVIARFDWDSHFPQPVWGVAQRAVHPPAAERLKTPLIELDRRVASALSGS